MALLKGKLCLLTLNTHSLMEWDEALSLDTLTNAVLEQDVDIFTLQEVNQGIHSTIETQQMLRALRFHTCEKEPPIRCDNYALKVAKMLQEKGACFDWTWVYAHCGYQRFEEGVAVFSRMPVLQCDSLNLSAQSARACRTTAGMQVAWDGKPLWVYSVHMGWWQDPLDPFLEQWKKLQSHCADKVHCCLMGDFNNPAHKQGEGYTQIIQDGWADTFLHATQRDSGITVGGKIDGWRRSVETAMRIDFAFTRGLSAPGQSRILFDGTLYPVISDHYGVMTKWP